MTSDDIVEDGGRDDGCWAQADKTIYIVPDTVLRHQRRGHKGKGKATRIRALAPRDNVIVLRQGDELVLTRSLEPGRPASVDDAGRLLTPARIGCTLPEVFDDVRAGESIWFDDGKIGGVIEKVEHERLHVRITQARARGEKLRADKGINLPDMLLAAMRAPCCGVMIARGDLAVESGFERLAEVQEEILWICEAAHVPVIWATQVLESLARDGRPSRAEITDAAMGDRAECVMLNKGPYIVDAVATLDDILKRMQAHQDKKYPMLRMLRLAHALGVADAQREGAGR